MRQVAPSERHKAFRDDAIALLRKHAEQLPAEEILALAAHLVGQTLAMQDQRTMTPERGMEIVVANIEAGNHEAIANLTATKGAA